MMYINVCVCVCVLCVCSRLSKKGTAIESFVIVEGGDAMDTFCDPGIQDPHSADEHRLREKTGVAAVEIENVGPIQEVSIPVKAGSVVVLRGSNGVGKTTAIESIKAAVNGKSDAKLTPADGSEREGGSIEFNGVLMRVGGRIS